VETGALSFWSHTTLLSFLSFVVQMSCILIYLPV